MSPTGPRYPTTASSASGSHGAWTNPTNVEVVDGVYASGNISGAGSSTNNLLTSGYGFSLPSTAVIDGIQMDFLRYGLACETQTVQIIKGGALAGSSKTGTDTWPTTSGAIAWETYGGATDLWGASWLYSDINNSGFGVALSALDTSGGGSAFIDAVRITVYWHSAPTTIPRTKYYVHKVYDSQTGAYIANLPNVSSDFAFTQNINTVAVQMTVNCAVSADSSALPTTAYTDESGNPYTDENSNAYVSEGTAPYTGIGTGATLIRDGNTVKIWEYGYYHPNGFLMLSGIIERHTDNFGGDTGDNDVALIIYSDSQDMDNFLSYAPPYTYTLDVSQTANNSNATLQATTAPLGYFYYGQTWTVGTGVTNLGAINLLLNGSADVTVTVYDSAAMANVLGTTTQTISLANPTVIQFGFPNPIVVAAHSQHFFTVTVPPGESVIIYYQNTAVYSGGTQYYVATGTGFSNGTWIPTIGDLYFQTFSGTGTTLGTFTAADPTTGMLEPVLNDYGGRGGSVGYTASTIQATGLSLTYQLQTNTIDEVVAALLTLSPNGFYYYVDVGANLLYFQEASETADFILTKGVHINKLSVVSTIEYIVNACYVVGGADVDNPGFNVYTYDYDAESIALYGLRLQIHTDNNITDSATAHIVGSSIVAANKDEQYQTSVTILDGTMDITELVPGKNIGFNGFGTYVDGLIAQIVTRQYTSEQVTLTLGILPKQTTIDVEKVVRGLVALQSVNNPDAPS